jgi:hypothetical protein
MQYDNENYSYSFKWKGTQDKFSSKDVRDLQLNSIIFTNKRNDERLRAVFERLAWVGDPSQYPVHLQYLLFYHFVDANS